MLGTGKILAPHMESWLGATPGTAGLESPNTRFFKFSNTIQGECGVLSWVRVLLLGAAVGAGDGERNSTDSMEKLCPNWDYKKLGGGIRARAQGFVNTKGDNNRD